jgi:hypothetical protein
LSSEPAVRNPITGIAGCCARAASGHAAAPPPSKPCSKNAAKHPVAVIVGEERNEERMFRPLAIAVAYDLFATLNFFF